MPPRFSLLLALLLAALVPDLRLQAGTALASGPTLTFFSSIDGEPFARLEAAAVVPDHVQHGPFRLPAPGLRLESPVLLLFDRPCSAEDWSRFLRDLAAWRRPAVADDFLITLPDGRTFAFVDRRPTIERQTLRGLLTALAASSSGEETPPSRHSLRVTHDATRARLTVDLASPPEESR